MVPISKFVNKIQKMIAIFLTMSYRVPRATVTMRCYSDLLAMMSRVVVVPHATEMCYSNPACYIVCQWAGPVRCTRRIGAHWEGVQLHMLWRLVGAVSPSWSRLGHDLAFGRGGGQPVLLTGWLRQRQRSAGASRSMDRTVFPGVAATTTLIPSAVWWPPCGRWRMVLHHGFRVPPRPVVGLLWPYHDAGYGAIGWARQWALKWWCVPCFVSVVVGLCCL